MRIEVTQEDIANGVMTDSDLCPIALAVNRVLRKTPYRAEVTVSMVMVHEGDLTAEITLPAEAREFVCHFDEDCDVAPFTFDLDYTPPATP